MRGHDGACPGLFAVSHGPVRLHCYIQLGHQLHHSVSLSVPSLVPVLRHLHPQVKEPLLSLLLSLHFISYHWHSFILWCWRKWGGCCTDRSCRRDLNRHHNTASCRRIRRLLGDCQPSTNDWHSWSCCNWNKNMWRHLQCSSFSTDSAGNSLQLCDSIQDRSSF